MVGLQAFMNPFAGFEWVSLQGSYGPAVLWKVNTELLLTVLLTANAIWWLQYWF